MVGVHYPILVSTLSGQTVPTTGCSVPKEAKWEVKISMQDEQPQQKGSKSHRAEGEVRLSGNACRLSNGLVRTALQTVPCWNRGVETSGTFVKAIVTRVGQWRSHFSTYQNQSPAELNETDCGSHCQST